MHVFWGKPWGRYRSHVVYADTDGLLDSCGCGAHAGFEYDGSRVRARCTDCLEMTDWAAAQDLAMIVWNVTMRKGRSSAAAQRSPKPKVGGSNPSAPANPAH